jgi:hypothetical protein
MLQDPGYDLLSGARSAEEESWVGFPARQFFRCAYLLPSVTYHIAIIIQLGGNYHGHSLHINKNTKFFQNGEDLYLLRYNAV